VTKRDNLTYLVELCDVPRGQEPVLLAALRSWKVAHPGASDRETRREAARIAARIRGGKGAK
jgi:hypothetical protein